MKGLHTIREIPIEKYFWKHGRDWHHLAEQYFIKIGLLVNRVYYCECNKCVKDTLKHYFICPDTKAICQACRQYSCPEVPPSEQWA